MDVERTAAMTQGSYLSTCVEASEAAPLMLLAKVVNRARPSATMASLGMQLSSALTQLSSYLWIRGEAALEHYYAEALTLACLEVEEGANATSYKVLLTAFIRFDRRDPKLPAGDATGLRLQEKQALHFIQTLRDQGSFQKIYEAARQLERYGAVSRTRKKVERIVLFAREMTGQSLLQAPSAAESLYIDLAAPGPRPI